MCNHISKLKVKLFFMVFLNSCLIICPIFITIIFLQDYQNADLEPRITRNTGTSKENIKIHSRDHRQPHFYPLGGVLTLLTASIVDVLAVTCYISYITCDTSYEQCYTTFNIMNLFLTVTGGVLLFATDKTANDYMNDAFKTALFNQCDLRNLVDHNAIISSKNDNDTDPQCQFVDQIQKAQRCCGYDSPNDWTRSLYWDPTFKILPNSCCKTSQFIYCLLDNGTMRPKGCKNLVFPTFNAARQLAKLLALFKFFIILLTMICSATVFREKYGIPNKPACSNRHLNYSMSVLALPESETDE